MRTNTWRIIIATFVLVIGCFLCNGASVDVQAATINYRGTDGDLKWSVDSDGLLTITGEGDYLSKDWLKHTDCIKKAKVSVTGITNMSEMFYGCNNLVSIDFTGTDTSQVTVMVLTFYGCEKLESLDLSMFDTGLVNEMVGMFSGCSALTSLDISSFDTSRVTLMRSMFDACMSLKNLDVSKFNTSQVTDMEAMFSGCFTLECLDFRNFDMSQVTCAEYMLNGCESLVTVKAPGNTSSQTIALPEGNWVWIYKPTGKTTGNITKSGIYTKVFLKEKGEIFTKSSAKYKVTKSAISNGTVQYVISMKKTAKTITVPNEIKIDGITYKVTSIAANAFKNNKKVTKITIGNNVTTIGKSAFAGCTKLKTLTIGSKVKTISDKAFKNCTSLTKITIPSKVTKIGKETFSGCKKLKTITIKSKSLKTVGKNTIKGINKKAKIDVPNSKKKAYKKLFKTSTGFKKTMTIK